MEIINRISVRDMAEHIAEDERRLAVALAAIATAKRTPDPVKIAAYLDLHGEASEAVSNFCRAVQAAITTHQTATAEPQDPHPC